MAEARQFSFNCLNDFLAIFFFLKYITPLHRKNLHDTRPATLAGFMTTLKPEMMTYLRLVAYYGDIDSSDDSEGEQEPAVVLDSGCESGQDEPDPHLFAGQAAQPRLQDPAQDCACKAYLPCLCRCRKVHPSKRFSGPEQAVVHLGLCFSLINTIEDEYRNSIIRTVRYRLRGILQANLKLENLPTPFENHPAKFPTTYAEHLALVSNCLYQCLIRLNTGDQGLTDVHDWLVDLEQMAHCTLY